MPTLAFLNPDFDAPSFSKKIYTDLPQEMWFDLDESEAPLQQLNLLQSIRDQGSTYMLFLTCLVNVRNVAAEQGIALLESELSPLHNNITSTFPSLSTLVSYLSKGASLIDKIRFFVLVFRYTLRRKHFSESQCHVLKTKGCMGLVLSALATKSGALKKRIEAFYLNWYAYLQQEKESSLAKKEEKSVFHYSLETQKQLDILDKQYVDGGEIKKILPMEAKTKISNLKFVYLGAMILFFALVGYRLVTRFNFEEIKNVSLLWAVVMGSTGLVSSLVARTTFSIVIISIFATPFSLAVPGLNTGMVAMFLQAVQRPLRTIDLVNLSRDLRSWRAWYRNRLLHPISIMITMSMFIGPMTVILTSYISRSILF